MSDNSSSLYLENIIKLSRTLVIKSTAIAEMQNNGLRDLNIHVDTEDPYSWKYYDNLFGVYHNTDSIMYVRSHDTLQDIEFTKENLENHPATLEAYHELGEYYEQLVGRYPGQEWLIRGILHPIDKDLAIASDEYTILYHDPRYVEEQETTLVSGLQEWIWKRLEVHNVEAYALGEEFYPTALFGVITMSLPAAIQQLRLANCHTEFVHSYHVWNYLSGQLALDDFKAHLTFAQALWLYRDIRYMRKFSGSQKILELLVTKLFEERGLRVYGRRVLHDVENLVSGQYPPGVVEIHPLDSIVEEIRVETIPELMDKTMSHGIYNELIDPIVRPEIEKAASVSKDADVSTRVIEVVGSDKSRSMPYSLDDVAFNQWWRWVMEGTYTSTIEIPNPIGGNNIAVTAKEAVLLYLYVRNAADGNQVTVLPKMLAGRTLKQSVNISSVRDKFESGAISDEIFTGLTRNFPRVGLLSTPSAFNEKCIEIFNYIQSQRDYVSSIGHKKYRGIALSVSEQCYEHFEVDFGDLDVQQWVVDKGWNIDSMGRETQLLLADKILETITHNHGDSTLTLTRMQEAMIGIARRLTAHDLLWLSTIDVHDAKECDWSIYRCTNIQGLPKQKYLVDTVHSMLDQRGHISHYVKDLIDIVPTLDLTVITGGRVIEGWDTGLNWKGRDNTKHVIKHRLTQTNILDIEDTQHAELH